MEVPLDIFRSFIVLKQFSMKYPLVMTNIAMEHGPVEIVDFPIKNGGSFHSYVKLPEGKSFSYSGHPYGPASGPSVPIMERRPLCHGAGELFPWRILCL